MQYEWDEAKREANLRKHNLDFNDANLIYDHPDKVTLPSETLSEERWRDIAMVEFEGDTLTLVYTERGYNIRVISFRKSSRKERRIYDHQRNAKSD